MDFQHYVEGQLVLVRWRNPSVDGAAEVASLLEQRHRAIGTRLVFSAVIGPDAPPPTPEQRDAMLGAHDRSFAYCSNHRIVILGGGLKRAIQRSILAGMGLALSLRGRGFALDGTMREFADSIEKLLAIRAPQLIQQLVTRQIISPEEAVE